MFLSFISRLGGRSTAPKPRVRRPVAPPRFRPGLTVLEGREVPAAPVTSLGQLGAARVAAPISQLGPVIPLQITNVSLAQTGQFAGQLVANGIFGGQAFQAPVTLTSSPTAANAATSILNLHLGPINLNVLGLQVKTS